MSEKLCNLSTGDEVYFYDNSIVICFQGKRSVLSTSLYNGGYHEDFDAIYNYDAKPKDGRPCEVSNIDYVEYMRLVSEHLGLDADRVSGMATAASMENVAIESLSFQELTVTAIVTGGIETNGGRVGDPADYYKPLEKPVKFGTINIMLVMDCNLDPGTLARALVTCTEAKTAAIQELMDGSKYSTGLATGSGTDQTMLVVNAESKLNLDGAGKHSKLGELIGKTVMKAVKKALAQESGLSPTLQHNAFRRLKRYGVQPKVTWEEFHAENPAIIKPRYLVAAEKLARENAMLTYTSLYVHLLDQCAWELISAQEMREAGQSLLDILATKYNVEKVELNGNDNSAMLTAWKLLFNHIVEHTFKA